MKELFPKPGPTETYEHLGEDLGRASVGDIILKAEEFGERLELQGEEGAQKAIEQARAPEVKVDTNIWGHRR